MSHATARPHLGPNTRLLLGIAGVFGLAGACQELDVSAVRVAQVAIEPTAATVTVGQTRSFAATPQDAQGRELRGRNVSWSSDHPDIAAVDGDGQVSGVAPGTARITASSEGRSGEALVTVMGQTVHTVEVSPSEVTISRGQTHQLESVAKTEDGSPISGRTATWSSANSAIASVDDSGVVTGLAEGATRITATIDEQSGDATVTVHEPVATVEVMPGSASVVEGNTTQLEALVKAADGSALSGRTITWSSENANIASVNGNGVVTGVAEGSARITATAEGKSGQSTITVTRPRTATIEIQPPSPSLAVGGTLQLEATAKTSAGEIVADVTFTWASATPAVASVDGQGTVTGVAAGEAEVTASAEGVTGSATVSVVNLPVDAVRIDPPSPSLVVDGTVQLQAVLTAADGTTLTGRTVTWASNNAGVATITANGLVRGMAAGTATITATAEGKSGTATVEVSNKPVANVSIQPPADTLVVGDTVRLAAVLTAEDNTTLTGRAVAWSTSDAQIAQVDQSGKVTAVAPGDATITATSEGKSGQAAIRVTHLPVATVEVLPATAAVLVGGTQAYQAVLKTANGATVTDRQVSWRTLTPAVATVAPGSGLALTATATAVGAACTGQSCAATIEATAEGVAGTATLNVRKAIATIELSPSAQTLAEGASLEIQASVKAGDGTVLTGRSLSWSSSSSNLTVQPSGNTQSATATAVAATCAAAVCTVTVTASAEGKSGTSTITIPKAVATVEVDPSSVSLFEDQTRRVRAIVKASDGSELANREVSWTTSSQSIAGVNGIGQLNLEANVQARNCPSGSSSCTATITASAEGKSGTVQVTVRKRVANVEVQPASVTLPQGGTRSLKAVLTASDNTALTDRAVTWSTSAAGVAQAEGSGTYGLDATLTAVGLGTATITATAEGVAGTVAVTVIEPVATIEVSPSTISLAEGATAELQALVKGASGATLADRAVTWTSTNGSRASVTGTGEKQQTATLTAGSCPVGSPSCTVTVRATAEGVTGSTAVTVTKQVAAVSVTPSPPPDLFPGETVQLTATPRASDGTDLTGIGAVTWASSAPATASVTGGLVTANAAQCAAGSHACQASISATVSGRSGSVIVNVLKPVAEIELAPDPPPDLYPDETVELLAKLTASDGTDLTGVRTVAWSSANTEVARVDDGLVTAVGAPCEQGAPSCVARITAEANGVSEHVDVRVLKPVATVEVNPALALVRVGHTQGFGATLRAADGTTLSSRAVTWSWNGLLGAEISLSTTNGNSTVATGRVVGVVTLTATAEGTSGSATVTITP